MSARLFVYLLVCVCGRLAAAELAPVSSGVLSRNIDPAKSVVHFTLGATLHTVHGTFRVESGTLRFDPGSGKASFRSQLMCGVEIPAKRREIARCSRTFWNPTDFRTLSFRLIGLMVA
jgi:hypothetical protein